MPNSAEGKTYALFQTPNNKKLIAELSKISENLFLFPPLETEKVTLSLKESKLLTKITEFDWLIFPDVFAVDYFLEFLSENDVDFFELDAVRVCAFNEIVADRLRFSQIHADVIPGDSKTETIFSAISFYAGAENLANLKMLLVKEVSAKFELSNLLSAAKTKLIEVGVYEIQAAEISNLTKLKTLLKNGAIDEFIFSASEDLLAVQHYFRDKDELSKIFDEVKAAAIDGNIFLHLKENNFKAHYFIRQ